MSRWFRHYGGLARDEKLVSVAVKSRQSVERVIWVWSAILESASEINDNGRYEFDTAEAAYFLRCDDAELGSILTCMESLGRIAEGVVVRWGDRQYSSDSAAERQRRYRERKSGKAGIPQDDSDDKRNGDVTVTSPSVTVTAQDTDTDTDTDTEKKELGLSPQAASKAKNGSRLSDEWVLPKAWGDWALGNLKGMTPEVIRSQADQFRDYWVGKAGAGARKNDWEATWRNWMRKASERLPRGSPNPKRTVVGVLDELISEMENAETIRPDQDSFGIAPHAGYLAAPQRDG